MNPTLDDVYSIHVHMRLCYVMISFPSSAPPTVSSLTYDSDTQTLTCTSTDSPATNVTWTKEGNTLTVDGTTYNMTQTVIDRRTSTYENVLTLLQQDISQECMAV